MRNATIRVILAGALAVSCLGLWSVAFAEKGDPVNGKLKYFENMRCSSCHGDTGKGDGPAAIALNPKPRNYTDCTEMGKKSDMELFKAVKEGGPSVNMSPLMVAFSSQLSDKEVWDTIAYIRSIPNPPCKVTAK